MGRVSRYHAAGQLATNRGDAYLGDLAKTQDVVPAPLMRQMLRVYQEELPRVSLFFPANPFAYVAGLQGPAVAAPESRVAWNVHEWDVTGDR